MARSITLAIPDFKLPSNLTRNRASVAGIVVLALIAMFFWKDISAFVLYRNSGEREVQRLLMDIAPNVAVPDDEVPALATITDKQLLSQGGVLKDARNGDQLLLYYKSGKAYVYRPSSRKVIAIGPLVVDPSAQQVSGSKIVIRNGSEEDAKYKEVVVRMKQRYPNAEVIEGGKAARGDYPKTIIIDMTSEGKKAEFSRAIGELIDGQIGILPIGESKPESDLLIIVGNDK